MDVSQRVIQIRRSYGGSDRVSPSFNAPQYIRYGSIQDPVPLGSLPEGDLFIDSKLGGESGSNSLFFQFELDEPARIACRITPTQRRTDQYISLQFSGEEGNPISGNGEGYTSFPYPFFTTSASNPVLDSESYVVSGYWVSGYVSNEGFTEQAASSVQQLENRLIPSNDPLPPGRYLATVASSQWVELPFRLQLSRRGTVTLSGLSQLGLIPSGRTSLVRFTGSITIQLIPTGRILNQLQLGGEAVLPLEPLATVQRTSPYGP